jgi:hypothetical protein
MPVGPLSHANLRVLADDPTYGDNATQRARMSIESTAKGNALVWTTTANDISQIAFTFELQTPFKRARMGFWMWFEEGFPLGDNIGGKIPGPAGTLLPVTKNPPSGGTTATDGWGGRLMFNGDTVGGNLASESELTAYVYDHLRSGQGQHATPPFPLSSGGVGTGIPIYVEQEIGMNTVGTEGSATQPTDGAHKLWVDGTLIYDVPRDWRRHAAVWGTHIQWSQFFGGDVTWAPTTGPWRFYIAQPTLTMLEAVPA